MFDFLKKKAKSQNVAWVEVYAVADGEFLPIEEVEDPVFSQKMMGGGYAVLPDDGTIYSPLSGKVSNVFPTKHAIGFEAGEKLEVLLHMGIDTVELDGDPFEVFVTEEQKVAQHDQVAEVDLAELAEKGKNEAMIVVFTNEGEAVDHIEWTLDQRQAVSAGDLVAKVFLK